jgi:ubiquinone/menaquinone biosynthesis C-methylase UbiE
MDPKTMWGSGNFAAVAERISEVGELVVKRAGIEPGMDVLDVACGTGNATLPAARTGARVTGLDFAPRLLEIARERAADAMVEVEFVEGDAQQLPFADATFDRVVSTFGHMFGPDHRRTADEMKRVLRPDGVIAVACWTPEGSIGRMNKMVAELVPPPPDAQPPLLWGTEEHVRELWGDAEFERHAIEWTDESVESYARFMLDSFGPLVSARATLAERGDELEKAYVHYLHRENEADDGTLRFRGEYLLTVTSKRPSALRAGRHGPGA